MAKHDRDPALRALVRSVDDAGQAALPVRMTVRGTLLEGRLVSERRYFAELAGRHPMMGALDPEAGLANGERYAKDVDAESGYHLHLIGCPAGGDADADELWRIRLTAVDGWALAPHDDGEDAGQGKGGFAGILSMQ